jgi:hypothetical protein
MFAPRIAKAPIKASVRLTNKRAPQDSTVFARPSAQNAPEHDPGGRESAPGVPWDFSKIPVVAPDRATSTAASDKKKDIRSIFKPHRHTCSAAIRRVSPAFRHDSMSGNERKPAMDFEAPVTQTAVTALGRSTPEPKEGETVHFPDSVFPSIAVPAQWDAIASTFASNSSITQHDHPPDPDSFGTTRPFYDMTGASATQTAGGYLSCDGQH